MKVLWVSTAIIGPPAKILNSDYKHSSGTWITNEYEEYPDKADIVFLCGTRKKINGLYEYAKNEHGEAYCVELPTPATGVLPGKNFLNAIKAIIDRVKPDIIHIWGTETCLQTAVAIATPNIKKVVYIQGILGIHSRYKGGYLKLPIKYFASISGVKQGFIQKIQNRLFAKQGDIEKRIIGESENVIIDNMFSQAYCESFNNSIKCYYKKLEANNVFKNTLWKYDECEKETLFTVYGQSPDKGLHQLLKALTIVKRKHPSVVLKIPGYFAFNTDNNGKLVNKNKQCTPFENWLFNYIINNNIKDNTVFLGNLSQEEMANNIKKCNLFVNPSIMEVHCLSLREAMTVGTPCISSVCGTITEYLTNKKNGFLYRYEEPEILAFLISMLLENPEAAINIGNKARESMLNSNDTEISLSYIYNDILKSSE